VHKVRLRIGRSDEGKVWHDRRERVLVRALFCGAEEGVQDGDEELTAFLREDAAKGGIDSTTRQRCGETKAKEKERHGAWARRRAEAKECRTRRLGVFGGVLARSGGDGGVGRGVCSREGQSNAMRAAARCTAKWRMR
jgi:hypothetical protein